MRLHHLNSIGTVTLETPRLILSKIGPEDAEHMYNNWANDPEVTKYMTWEPHESVGVTRQILENWSNHYDNGNFFHWAIRLKETGMPIGTISLLGVSDARLSCELGYCIGQKWWHKGYMSEAALEVLKFAINQVGFVRVQAEHCGSNPNSGGVMRKIGMTYEGIRRKAFVTTFNTVEDLHMYAFVAGDSWVEI